jgi:hypothetical protein
MNYSTYIAGSLLPLLLSDVAKDQASAETAETLEQLLADVYAKVRQTLNQLGHDFLSQPVTPERTFALEHQLGKELRELGRQIMQVLFNRVEAAVESLPTHVHFEASQYTRLNKKTPQNVWTRFGQLRLRRVGYRPTDKTGDPTIFPTALALGLMHGASPALAERVAGLMGDTGMTQRTVLRHLQQDHGVGWGVKKLRQVTALVSTEMAEQRHEVQVEQLLAWLVQAMASKGRHKPGLSAGRDGITMGLRIVAGTIQEVASCGTLSVLDRRGRRLGTVYLARVPESGQGTLGQQLTDLVQDVLKRWEGTLPHLSYVTDSGDNETGYYDKVLSGMKHPRTGEPLTWTRVADYYHVSERLWTMAELLFGPHKADHDKAASAWVRKMQKWLLKPSGAYRVLHSAAALRSLRQLRGKKLQDFERAYNYLRDRLPYVRYADYRRLGIPLGSGVTEAACKTVFTQRLKLSGMRWKKAGAQIILDLRVLRLSGVWDQAYARVLQRIKQPQVRVQAAKVKAMAKKAA